MPVAEARQLITARDRISAIHFVQCGVAGSSARHLLRSHATSSSIARSLTWKLYVASGSKSDTVNDCLLLGCTCLYSLTADGSSASLRLFLLQYNYDSDHTRSMIHTKASKAVEDSRLRPRVRNLETPPG